MALGVMRSSDMVAMEQDSIRFSTEGVEFCLLNPKNAQGRTPPIKIARCESRPGICPVAALETYIRRSHCADSLWCSQRRPHRPLASKTIAKHVQRILLLAGVPPAFKAHSIRSAAVSKALELGIDLTDVLVHGRWRSERVFRTFYDRSRRGFHVSRTIALG